MRRRRSTFQTVSLSDSTYDLYVQYSNCKNPLLEPRAAAAAVCYSHGLSRSWAQLLPRQLAGLDPAVRMPSEASPHFKVLTRASRLTGLRIRAAIPFCFGFLRDNRMNADWNLHTVQKNKKKKGDCAFQWRETFCKWVDLNIPFRDGRPYFVFCFLHWNHFALISFLSQTKKKKTNEWIQNASMFLIGHCEAVQRVCCVCVYVFNLVMETIFEAPERDTGISLWNQMGACKTSFVLFDIPPQKTNWNSRLLQSQSMEVFYCYKVPSA